MILPEEDEVYITSNKTLFRFNQEYWIYNWKGLVWHIIDNKNAEKILMGHNFEYFHRFEEEPSLLMLKSFSDQSSILTNRLINLVKIILFILITAF